MRRVRFLNMFMVLLVGLGACSPLLNAQAQVQRAPTVEQCRADQKSVLSRLNSNERTLVSYKEGDGWFLEMQDCMSVDPENQARYYNTMSETSAMLNTRMQSYLKRHNQWNQFLAEDAQGKR